MKTTTATLFCLLIAFFASSQELKTKNAKSVYDLLQGKWQSEDDKNNFLIFEGNVRKEIYGTNIDQDNFWIANDCNASFAASSKNKNGKYLVQKDDMCWEIDVNETMLELVYMARGNTLRYKKVMSESAFAPSGNSIKGTYTVTAAKSYFYETPDYQTQRKAYLVKGNQVTIEKAQGDFGFGSFTSAAGKSTKGWILLSSLRSQGEGEKKASFAGGESAWKQYVQKNLNNDLVYKEKSGPGVYVVMVGFLVDADGAVKDVVALNDNGSKLNAEAVRIVKASPRWIPAQSGGKSTATFVKLPLSFFWSPE